MAIAALACCLAALTAVLLGQLRGDFQAIGQRDAPEAGATTGLYFALNDMDAQVANVLLVGGDSALAASRAQDLATYARDRAAIRGEALVWLCGTVQRRQSVTVLE